jgi:hypothetical protein
MKAYGGVDVPIHIFLTSALDGDEWSASRPSRFTPRERVPDTHWIGGWVDTRARTTWRRENPLPYRDSNSDTSVVQPIPRQYTDYAIPAHVWQELKKTVIIQEMKRKKIIGDMKSAKRVQTWKGF